MVDESDPVWSQLEPASFTVDQETILFPIWQSYEIEHGIRVAPRPVPWVNGEQLDETGTTAEQFAVQIPCFNSIQQEDPVYGAVPLYPDRLEQLCAMFRLRKTGTLHLMTRRNVRCKAIRWVRSGKVEERDGEVLSVSFVADNESRLDGPAVETVSVKVNLTRKLNEAWFEAERAGAGGASWEDLTTLAAQLDAAMSAPSEYRDDIQQKAHRLGAACDRVLDSYSRNVEGRSQFTDCAGYPARRALEEVRDMAYRADGETREQRPQVITRTYARPYSIWEVATKEHQDAGRLLYLNGQIEDPNWIPAGTPVLLEAP